jgi:diazepam-binding inhibitor (GABA receptor modulating acyl-CoA-binding protein)
MTTKELFEQAVADSKQLTSRPDNEILLKLYSLYKQATEGDANDDDAPSNPFDFVGKAKFTAWAERKGTSADDAMTQYAALVESLKK